MKTPFAWPARISEEVTKYPDLVDPDLFAQAKSYQKHIQSLIAEGHIPEGAARTLQERGYRFRGWSTNLITQILKTKEPRLPPVPRTLGPEFVSSWNREVLLDKLAESVRKGPFDPVPLPEFYKNIAKRAGRFQLGPELLKRMGPTAPQSLSDIISPPPWSTRASRMGESILGQIQSIPKLPTGYKVAGGLAVGLLGLYALQPGSWFSGKDDSYNTIKGLGHSGIAQYGRRELTDFGSGYQGEKDSDPSFLASILYGGLALQASQSAPLSFIGSQARELLTGRAMLFHGTSYSAAEKIRKEGLKTSFTGASGITTKALGKKFVKEHKGLTYLTRGQFIASTYAYQAENLARDVPYSLIQKRLPIVSNIYSIFGPFLEQEGIVKFDVPSEILSKFSVKNPETSGISLKQWFNKGKNPVSYLSLKHSTVLNTNLGPEFITNNSLIGNLSKQEVFSHWKKYPGKVAKGLGLLSLGLGITAGIAKLGYNSFSALFHGGEAEKKRKELTDFGSGYRGLDLDDDKSISPIEKRFGKFAKALEKYGVEVGTAHKRIYIPKDIISKEELTEELGFVPVNIAIPEAGQTKFESFRHPRALYHLHEHGEQWTLHEDLHPAASMTIRKWQEKRKRGGEVTLSGFFKEIYAGMQHIFTEGIPGAFYYLRGQIIGTEGMIPRIREEISPQYQKFVNRIRKEKERAESISGRIWSGFGRAYNTIEGLFHGGQAERKRKELTDFGSGWIGKALSKSISPLDIATKIAKTEVGTGISGLTVKEFATKAARVHERGLRLFGKKGAESVFTKFMRQSYRIQGDKEVFQVVKAYRSGGFGRTFKVYGKTTGRAGIYKQTLKANQGIVVKPDEMITGPAVRGKARNVPELMRLFDKNPNRRQYIEEYMGMIEKSSRPFENVLGPRYEAAMQRAARQEWGDIVPEVLGVTKTGFIQEFAGAPLPHVLESVPYLKKAENIWKNITQKSGQRIRHFDPQIENVVRQGTRLRVIDWGVAARGELSPLSHIESGNVAEQYVKSLSKELSGISGLPPKSNTAVKNLREADTVVRLEDTVVRLEDTVIRERKMAQTATVQRRGERVAQQQNLHTKAQKDLWANTVKAGRGHVTKSSNISLVDRKTGF